MRWLSDGQDATRMTKVFQRDVELVLALYMMSDQLQPSGHTPERRKLTLPRTQAILSAPTAQVRSRTGSSCVKACSVCTV